MKQGVRWLAWVGTAALLAFYAYVGMLAAQPQVSHLYRLYYVDKSLRAWNHGKGPVYLVGQQLDFREALPFLSRVGWAYPEDWGTWTDGPVAELHFRVQGLPRSLSMDVNPFVAPQAGLPAQTLRIFANGVAVGEYRLQAAQTLSVDLPASAMANGTGYLTLRFELPQAASPRKMGLSPDGRLLGIGVRRFSLN